MPMLWGMLSSEDTSPGIDERDVLGSLERCVCYLTSFCESSDTESCDALLANCVCSAPDVIPVLNV